ANGTLGYTTGVTYGSSTTPISFSDGRRRSCVCLCEVCYRASLSGATRARDRAVFARRPNRCFCTDRRRKSFAQSRSAVLRREPTGRRCTSWHGSRSPSTLRWLHHDGREHELHRQSQPLSENSVRPAQGFC